MSETNSVVAIFESHESSEDAIRKLQNSGFELRQLTLVEKNVDEEDPGAGNEAEPKSDQFYLVGPEKAENQPPVKMSADATIAIAVNPATESPYTPESVRA